MNIKYRGMPHRLIASDAVRVSEERVEQLAQEVFDTLLSTYRRNKTENDMTYIATGDAFVFGVLEIGEDGEAFIEIEVLRPERRVYVEITGEGK